MKIGSLSAYFSALSILAMLAPTACGGDTGGSGGGTTATSTIPASPAGAFFLTLAQDNPLTCNIAGHSAQVGSVTDTDKKTVVADGMNQTRVDCSVQGSGTFQVHGKIDDTSTSGNYLEIFVPALAASATATSPAEGSIVYASPKTVASYSGDACKFYFENAHQTVAQGKVWVSFDCSGITSGQSTCPVPVGYVIFENCPDSTVE